MIRKSTWIVLGIFVVLLAGLLILQRSGNLEFTAESTPSPTQAVVFGLDTGKISNIKVSSNAGDFASFSKNPDGSWIATEPEGFQPENTTVNSALDTISTWTIQDELSVVPPLDAVGLVKPGFTLELKMDSGQEHIISIGVLNPAQTGYYLQLDGGSPFLVSRYSLDPVIQLLDLLHITPTPPPGDEATPGITATP